LYDFFLVAAATILTTFVIKLLVEQWKRHLGIRPGRAVSAQMRVILQARLLLIAIFSLVLGIVIVVLDRIPAADPYTPYEVILFSASIAGAVLVESSKKLVEFKSS
jgi:hypothetical protein